MFSNIYLDHNATTFVHDEVREVMMHALSRVGNPSSSHTSGRYARSVVENARISIKNLINAQDCNVIFTSTGTEANNLAINGLIDHKIVTSLTEHPSVIQPAMKQNAVFLPVTSDGLIDLEGLRVALQEIQSSKIFLSVMLANNETGVIQPIRDIVNVAREFDAIVHSDVTQCIGKIEVDMQDLGLDMMTISAHKFGGPQGAAALIVKSGIEFNSQILGGGQEQNRRAGTENVAAICGFGRAAQLIIENKYNDNAHIAELRDLLEYEITKIAPEVIFFGSNCSRLPNTSCISMPGVTSDTQIIHFDLCNIAVSAGSACSSGKIESSHVLAAMGVPKDIANTAIRVSLGCNNNTNDISMFVQTWEKLYSQTTMKKAA